MAKEEELKKTREALFLEPKDRIIFALNTSDFVRAECLVRLLSGYVGYFKFGPELTCAMLASMFCPSDAAAVDNLMKIRSIFTEAKGRIFWDGRLAGIAGTVGPTTRTLSDLGVSMLSVQGEQGMRSIIAATENKGRSMLFAATPRSSVDREDCRQAKGQALSRQVARLMQAVISKGIDGVICSSHETAGIRAYAPELLIAARDVRPDFVPVKDRSKVITPSEAIAAGADAVIIGKPISQPPCDVGGPVRSAELIVQEISEALSKREASSNMKGGGSEAE